MRGIYPYNVVGYSIYHLFTLFQIWSAAAGSYNQAWKRQMSHGFKIWLHSSFFSNNRRCNVNKESSFVIHHRKILLKRRVFQIKPIFTIDDVMMWSPNGHLLLTVQVALHQRFYTVNVEQLTRFSSGALRIFLKVWNQKLHCGLSMIMPLGKLPPEAAETI